MYPPARRKKQGGGGGFGEEYFYKIFRCGLCGNLKNGLYITVKPMVCFLNATKSKGTLNEVVHGYSQTVDLYQSSTQSKSHQR